MEPGEDGDRNLEIPPVTGGAYAVSRWGMVDGLCTILTGKGGCLWLAVHQSTMVLPVHGGGYKDKNWLKEGGDGDGLAF